MIVNWKHIDDEKPILGSNILCAEYDQIERRIILGSMCFQEDDDLIDYPWWCYENDSVNLFNPPENFPCHFDLNDVNQFLIDLKKHQKLAADKLN